MNSSDDKEKIFVLTSWGNSGVNWVYKCLNLYPNIRAFCGTRKVIQKTQGFSVCDYLRELVKLSHGYEVIADIHSVSPHEFPFIQNEIGKAFFGAHLIANPIQRIAGSMRISEEMGRNWDLNYFCDMWKIDEEDEFVQIAKKIIGPKGNYVPVSYIKHLNSITLLPKESEFFHLDKLMTDHSHWKSLFDFLLIKNEKTMDDRWKQFEGEFFGIAHEPFKEEVEQTWEGFDNKTKALFKSLVSEETLNIYEDFGYNLKPIIKH